MSWHPNDLVADDDLEAYERTIFSQFDRDGWPDRRQKALEDWLFPLLEGQGFAPHRLRTRYEPTSVLGYTSSAYSDKTTAAAADDGLVLSTILATSSDRLFIGSRLPFRGLSVRMLDTVNAAALTLSVHVWADSWLPAVGVQNATAELGKPFTKGGSILWTNPEGLAQRTVNSVGPYYWARLTLSTAPTAGTAIGPLLVVRRSRLCAAATYRTLALIFREAPTAQEGPWTEKAAWYEQQATEAWLRVLDHIGGEFDSDGSDALSEAESVQTALETSGGGWAFERA